MLSESIYRLVRYGMDTGLTPECEKNYTINLLLELLRKMITENQRRAVHSRIWKRFLKRFWTRPWRGGSYRMALCIGIYLIRS